MKIKDKIQNKGHSHSPLGVGGLLFLLFLLASCSGTSRLPGGERLYTGATIKVLSTENVSKRMIRKVAKEALRPKPNTSYAGLRPQLCVLQTEKAASEARWLMTTQ